jgi:hypothetical protein
MKYFSKRPSITLIIGCLVLLTACGGGGNTTQTPATTSGTVTSQTAQPPTIAGKSFIAMNGSMFSMIFNEDMATGTMQSLYPLGVPLTHFSTNEVMTWNLSGNALKIAFNDHQVSYAVSADGNTLIPDDPLKQQTYTASKPLSLATLDGKHLEETLPTGSYCTARTLSFTRTTLTVREQCGNVFDESSLSLDEVVGVNNRLRASTLLDGKPFTVDIELQDGSMMNKGTLVFSSATREYRQKAPFVVATQPLQKQADTPLVSSTASLSSLFSAYGIPTRDNDPNLKLKPNLTVGNSKCSYTPYSWARKSAFITCPASATVNIYDPYIINFSYYNWSSCATEEPPFDPRSIVTPANPISNVCSEQPIYVSDIFL